MTQNGLASEKTLIVAHAQHPLFDGVRPGVEFAARLDAAAEVYNKGEFSEYETVATGFSRHIYVPGSRHRANGVNDQLSLSDAGSNYLTAERAIPAAAVHGEDWTRKYAGQKGVYNAANEAKVASQAFLEEPNGFGRLISVCSPTQRDRLEIHYDAQGVQPEFVTPEANEDYHAGLAEKVLTIYTQFVNPSWNRGLVPALIRSTRVPNDGLGIESIPAAN